MNKQKAVKPFTGWHMTAILVGFFAVVMAVNFTMASFAMSTFGGMVVENSYVASQHYNELLDRAAAQEALGWDETITLDGTRHVELRITRQGRPLAVSSVTAMLSHPLGRVPATTLHFVPYGAGTKRSVEVLAPGRWRLDASVRHGGSEARYRSDLQ